MTSDDAGTALTVAPRQKRGFRELMSIATVLAKSGMFSVKDEYQAAAKIMIGDAFGWAEPFSLMNIYLLPGGKLSISATAMAVQVRRSGRYDYEVRVQTNEEASVEFSRLEWDRGTSAKRVSLGTSTFTLSDAKRAGLLDKDNWRKYPKAMLLSRAMSAGVRTFTPDVFLTPVYAEGEIVDANWSDAPAILEVTTAPASALPTMKMGVTASVDAPLSSFAAPPPAALAPGVAAQIAGNDAAMTAFLGPDRAPSDLDEFLPADLVDRVLALPAGGSPTEDDMRAVGAAVESTMGGAPAAKAAWLSAGFTWKKGAAPPTKEQIVSLGRNLAQRSA